MIGWPYGCRSPLASRRQAVEERGALVALVSAQAHEGG